MGVRLARRNRLPNARIFGVPTISAVSARDGAAAISWTPPSALVAWPGVSSYEVTASPADGSATVDGNTLQALVTGLTNGTDYTFTVKAVNAAGDGLASAASSTVTPSADLAGAATSLPFAPPHLFQPVTKTISTSGGTQSLTAGQDYIIQMPASAVTSELSFSGGRNIVIIGGQVAIPNKGDSTTLTAAAALGATSISVASTANYASSGTIRIGGSNVEEVTYSAKTSTSFAVSALAHSHASGDGVWPSIGTRQGMNFNGFTGTVHMEGVDIGGADCTEGVQFNAAVLGATVQMQNCRIGPMVQRDNTNQQDNHSDAIQCTGGPEIFRIANCTFHDLDYQGITFQPWTFSATRPTVLIDVRDSNIVGNSTSNYLFWRQAADTAPFDTEGVLEVSIDNVYMQVSGERGHTTAALSCWPPGDPYADEITDGLPDTDFCPDGVPGLNYVTPGYSS